jgi:hypothetical protein
MKFVSWDPNETSPPLTISQLYTHAHNRLILCVGPGRCDAPPFDWETLCGDLKQLVVAKLSLRDLACAACSCRHFRAAYLDRAAEERANLIALVKGAGKPVFSAFTTRLREAMSGSPSIPNLRYLDDTKPYQTGPIHSMLVTNVGEPQYAATQPDSAEWDSINEPHAMFCHTLGEHAFFNAWLYLQSLGADDAQLASSLWYMARCGETTMKLEIRMGIQQAAYVVAFVLAACHEIKQAARPPSRCPLTVHFLVTQGSIGRAGLREAEDLVAPLRHLCESVSIHRQYARIRRGFRMKAGIVVEMLELRV